MHDDFAPNPGRTFIHEPRVMGDGQQSSAISLHRHENLRTKAVHAFPSTSSGAPFQILPPIHRCQEKDCFPFLFPSTGKANADICHELEPASGHYDKRESPLQVRVVSQAVAGATPGCNGETSTPDTIRGVSQTVEPTNPTLGCIENRVQRLEAWEGGGYAACPGMALGKLPGGPP
ncbi:hypothetical protein MHUMG1_00889 [Metarhizium humberi]|uniref:Uncharacterized protein n=1 Tax=Metarhizium humberi TaxID=2596975 RepID=A0A9P8MJV1_9HYPO|nr:hypothetical protein MHUMG1_00889 [Metarhizium humberi]